ncbi:MAG: FGGY-family carbohydrate kinase [Bacilli bacterium]|nr:FGGY-family carbohydrate kinase [Bacilli bacterium]
MEKLILTIDFGTQSARAALVNKKGEIVAMVKKAYDPVYYSIKKTYAEQDPDYYFEILKQDLKELTSNNPDKLDSIIGATITTFRDSSVQLDKDLKPLRKCILWLDQRLADAKEKLPLLHRFAFALVGMRNTITLNRRRTIAHWLKENEIETWKKTYKYVNISGYLTYKITGNLVDSSASVTGHYPINFKKGEWYPEGALKGRIFGIPSSMLCELKKPGEVLGTFTDELAKEVGLPLGIKLIATGSDKACETVGLGALDRTIAAISYGTASTIEVSNQKYHEPEPFLPAYPAAIKGFYNMEVQVYRGYWMLTWFTKEFAAELFDEAKINQLAVEELANQRLNAIPPGSDGLVLQPYWGPGLRRPLSKGSIIGFSDIHTKYHMYRAIIEGIAYALKEGLEGIEKSQKKKVKSLMISGGGSQSDAICQITADIFGLPVSRVQTFETSSLGAAISTFVALKEFTSVEEATKAMVHKSAAFYPDEKANKKYMYLYKHAYIKIYPKIKGIYRDIKDFSDKDE